MCESDGPNGSTFCSREMSIDSPDSPQLSFVMAQNTAASPSSTSKPVVRTKLHTRVFRCRFAFLTISRTSERHSIKDGAYLCPFLMECSKRTNQRDDALEIYDINLPP
jgi:hypothetical protein